MKIRKLHSWSISPKKAVQIQRELAGKIRFVRLKKPPRLIAGADASFKHNKATGAVVVMTYPDLKIVESLKKTAPLKYPYIPTLLTFREGPVLLECFRALKRRPDLIIFDGQGIAHPRKMGLATHLGLFLNKPTIGCAKSRLTGVYNRVAPKKGSYSYIRNKKREIIGAALRTRDVVKPVFVSPGTGVRLEDSIKIILECSSRYRIPEPLRAAHHLCSPV